MGYDMYDYRIQKMDLSKLFVNNVRKWRTYRGLSQKALAERCDSAHSYIRQIESGKGTPSFALIEKLAGALNIEAYQLFYEEKTKDGEKIPQIEVITSIKTAFLTNISRELDVVIDKIKTNLKV